MAFEPKILGFFCNWCSYSGADLAGISRMQMAPNVRIIRTMCSGRVDPTFIMKAFKSGADGVIISGCHPGDCHYQEGNFKTLRRFALLKLVLKQFGIEEERFKLVWISASEAEKYAEIVNDFTEQIRRLGPLGIQSEGARSYV